MSAQNPQPLPARDRRPVSRRLIVAIAVAALALVALAATPVVFAATEKPAFCTSCHEMRPFYAAYKQGPHDGIDCTSCHVDPTVQAKVTHKFVALQEVWVHLTGKPRFPQGDAAVPDSRCRACHPKLPTKTASGFRHDLHTKGLSCAKCHAAVGHEVSRGALAAAGILDTAAPDPDRGVQLASTSATAGYAPDTARIAGHKDVSCLSCHALSSTRCSQCHTPKHAPRGECVTCHSASPAPKAFAFQHPTSPACTSCHTPKHVDRGTCTNCHKPGTTWAFKHPTGSPACGSCHKAPAKHFGGACAGCHRVGKPFASAKVDHRLVGRTCTTCHARPAGHRSGQCGTCHAAGVSWRFRHPGQSASCASCHKAPAKHFGSRCAGCHRVGVAFASAKVNHNAVGSGCASCHNRPAGHRSGTCLTCHRLKGVSWKFTHPSSTGCSSCHRAPANHYGTGCASCHSPSRAFANARFSHPRVPGGEHTYRSFACANCHPSGYSRATCAKCHGNAGGPSGD